jgi:uncharacterized tellurite resistance protein B-like protein
MTPMKGAPMCKLCGHEHDLGASHIFDGPKQPLSPPGELEAPMTEAERKRYDELKSIALVHWAIIGEALTEIRDSRLYREEHRTFEAFCQDVFGMTRQHANRLIGAAATAAILEPMVPKAALREGTIRPLAGLPAEQAREVYKATVDRVGPAPRARDIEATMSAPDSKAMQTPTHLSDPAATGEALTPEEEEADQLGEGIRWQGERSDGLAGHPGGLPGHAPGAALIGQTPGAAHPPELVDTRPPARASDLLAALERAGTQLADAFEQTERLGPLQPADRRQLNNDLSTLARAVARLQQLLALKG